MSRSLLRHPALAEWRQTCRLSQSMNAAAWPIAAPRPTEVMVEAKTQLQKRIDAERRREQEEDRTQSNRFE
jgi:hypothetical protein